MPRNNRVWEIEGRRSLALLFRLEVPHGGITSREVQQLLRSLTAKHGLLSDDEIVASFLKKNAKGRADHLEVRTLTDGNGAFSCYECGSNPYFTARVKAREA